MTDTTAPCILRFPDQQAAQRRAVPADLDRAIGALQQKLAPKTPAPAASDSFTPIGPVRPIWRAARAAAPSEGAGRAGVAAGAVAPHGPATERDALSRRIVSLHLTDFAMARWLRLATARQDAPPDDLPVVLAVEGPHGPVVTATNRAAALAGLHQSGRVVDMRALCPDLRVAQADPAGDRAALTKLMLWTRRWCPWTAVDGPDGIVLDTTGSDHLWGGESALLRDIEGTLSTLGFASTLAIAPTHGAAWALARYGPVRSIATPATLAALTAPLPARALRLDADTVLLLQRLGLKSIGDIAAVPRLSLARRFTHVALSQNPLARLDQLQGRLPEPVSASAEPPRFAVQARLAEPVQDPVPHLPALCAELCAGLAAAGFGARRVTVTIYRTDGEVSTVTAATARASRDPFHLCRLFDDKIDRIDPGFGFELITLVATGTEDMVQVQTRLDGQADDGAALAQLIDRLTARLGPQAVRSPVTYPSHIPERAEGWAPAIGLAPTLVKDRAATRPLRLFDHPEEIHVLYAVPEGPPAQFVWRRVTYRITRFAGPERIAPEWWNDRPGTRLRDYYRIEDQSARRFWIYRDGVWGDERGETPRWFVHGVFG